MQILEKEKISFESYDEYKNFVSAVGGADLDIDFDGAIYQALINNDCTPKEARNFLTHELTEEYLTKVRVYKDRLVLQFEGIEFIEDDYIENNIQGFIIVYYFGEKQWHWVEMF